MFVPAVGLGADPFAEGASPVARALAADGVASSVVADVAGPALFSACAFAFALSSASFLAWASSCSVVYLISYTRVSVNVHGPIWSVHRPRATCVCGAGGGLG